MEQSDFDDRGIVAILREKDKEIEGLWGDYLEKSDHIDRLTDEIERLEAEIARKDAQLANIEKLAVNAIRNAGASSSFEPEFATLNAIYQHAKVPTTTQDQDND